VALAPQALAPGHRQVPAVQLDVWHRPGRRAGVVGRPAVVATAQRRRRVPQVPVVVRDQRRGAVLSGQHGLPGRRRDGDGDGGRRRGGRGRHGRGPHRRRRAPDQQRRGLLATPVAAVRRRLRRHGGPAALRPPCPIT